MGVLGSKQLTPWMVAVERGPVRGFFWHLVLRESQAQVSPERSSGHGEERRREAV